MSKNSLQLDTQGRPIHVGDIVLWSWSWSSLIGVVRGLSKSKLLQLIGVQTKNLPAEDQELTGRPYTVRSYRDTIFKIEDRWLTDFVPYESIRVLMEERANILAGKYEKKTKNE